MFRVRDRVKFRTTTRKMVVNNVRVRIRKTNDKVWS